MIYTFRANNVGVSLYGPYQSDYEPLNGSSASLVTSSNITATLDTTSNPGYARWTIGAGNVTGDCWVNLVIPGAQTDVYVGIPALAASATQYVTVGGNDFNDGLSWHTAKATIQAAINALPQQAGEPNGTVEVGYGTLTENSTGWLDSVTYTNSTTVNDTNASTAYVGAYLVSVSVSRETYITSVVPGVSFTVNQPVSSTTTETCLITKPSIYLPGGVTLRGRGSSYLPANNTTINGTLGTLLNGTRVQDNGTGITVWLAASTSSDGGHYASRQVMSDLSVWGSATNHFGLFCLNGVWDVTLERCDFSYHGRAGAAFSININALTATDCYFNDNGQLGATTTYPTGGVLLWPTGNANSAGLTFTNCLFAWNYGVGIAAAANNMFGTSFTHAQAVTLIGCQFVGQKTTSASFPNCTTGMGAAVQSDSVGVSALIGCWFEQNTGAEQLAVAGQVSVINTRLNNNSGTSNNQYGIYVRPAASTESGPVFMGVFSSGATSAAVRVLQTSGSALTWIACSCTETTWVNLQTGGGSGIVTSIPQAQASLGSLGAAAFSGVQSALAGTTAGSATSSMPSTGIGYKKFLVYLNGYENTTATAQTITFPTAFTNAPYVAHDDSGGATVSTTTLTLPASMAATKTGWIVVEGY